MAGESLDPLVQQQGSLDPGVQTPGGITEVATSPQSAAEANKIQSISVAPVNLTVMQMTEQQQSFQKEQAKAEYDTKFTPILQQISRMEQDYDKNKPLVDKNIEKNKPIIDELKAYIAAEQKAQGQISGGQYRITTMGYPQYLSDIEAQKSQLAQYKSELTAARDNADFGRVEDLVDKVSESGDKLDKLYKIDPFSPEGQKLYPLKTTKTISIVGKNLESKEDLLIVLS